MSNQNAVETPASVPSGGRFGLPALLAVLVLIAAGVACFLLHAGRPAWFDESWVLQHAREASPVVTLAECIRNRHPLGVGFAGLMYGTARVADLNMWAFRVPTAVFGVALLMIAGHMAARWVGLRTLGAAAAMVLLACPLLQRYSTEIKQYIPEAALTLGLILATDWWSRTRCRRAGWVWFATSLAILLLTFSAWFAVAACGLVAGVMALRRFDRSHFIRVAVFGLGIAVVAGVVHLRFNKMLSGSEDIQDSWAREFIALGPRWPIEVWQRLASMVTRAWLPYSIPGNAFLFTAALGWFVWLWRRPIEATAAGLTMLITIAANAAELWPLGAEARVRINLPLITLLHMCALALPLGVAGFALDWWRRRRSLSHTPDAVPAVDQGLPKWLDWAGLAMVVLLAAAVVRESRSLDHAGARVDLALDEIASLAQPGDLVLLAQAAEVNQQFDPRPIRGAVLPGAWPSQATAVRDYTLPIATNPQARRVFIVAGYNNPGLAQAWSALGAHLSHYGEWEKVWPRTRDEERTARFVAIYRFEPRAPLPATMPAL